MIKVVEIFVGGLITGLIPSGIAFGMWAWKNRRAKNKHCRFVHLLGGEFMNCTGLPSMTCADSLCPAHCQDIHEGECFKIHQKG